MTTATKTQRQVFISFAPPDLDLATRVSADLSHAGLKVVRMDQMKAHGEYSDAVRTELVKSDAVVTVLSKVSNRNQIPASVLFEIGAAVGAEKRIFVVVEEMTDKLPFTVPHLQILPLSRVGEIATYLNDLDQ